jgi:aconitate hydratase
MLALTFANPDDYNKIQEDDIFNFLDLDQFAPNRSITIELVHRDGNRENIVANHTYNNGQIEWFKAGSALNLIKMNEGKN